MSTETVIRCDFCNERIENYMFSTSVSPPPPRVGDDGPSLHKRLKLNWCGKCDPREKREVEKR